MLEILALVLAVAGVFWARKQDINESLKEEASRHYVIKSIINPEKFYHKILSRALRFADKHLQRGVRCYFSIVFISFLYSSSLYMLSWGLERSPDFLSPLQNEILEKQWSREISLFLCILLFPICFYFAKYGEAVEKSLYKPNSEANISIITRLFFVPVIFAVMQMNSDSLIFSSVVAVAAGLGAVSIRERLPDIDVLTLHPRAVGFASAFGPTAFLMVVFSLIVGDIDKSLLYTISAVIFSLFLLSLGLGWYGAARSQGHVARAPIWTRASITMGVFIQRHFVGFAIAVIIAAAVPALLKGLGSGTFPVAVAAFLTSGIFLAGATSLGGAGFVVFSIIIVTTVTLYFSNVEQFSLSWVEPLFFWGIFPIVNSAYDFLTWNFSRYFARRILIGEGAWTVIWLIFDVFSVLILTYMLVATLALIVSGLNFIAIHNNGFFILDSIGILKSISQEPFGSGMWITLMILSISFPTIIHMLIVILSGLGHFVPTSWRRKLAMEVRGLGISGENEAVSRESLSWRIASIDQVTGIVVFFAIVIVIAYVGGGIVASIGDSLIFVANVIFTHFVL